MSQNHILLETIQLTQSGVSSVVLDNIPQTGYTDLKVVVSARTTRTGTDLSDELRLKFNNITSGYSTLMIEGNGSTTRTVADASGSYFGRGSAPADNATASTFGNTEYYIPNYAGSTNKTISIDTTSEHNGGEAMALVVSGLLTNTSAVTSLTFTAVGTYDAGSTFSIYGIAELGTNSIIAPFASGGNIVTNDGTYWYHAFLNSGTFTPAKALTCDILVVAGGGSGATGGNSAGAGGGGAGGLLPFTSQSLTAVAHSCIVGAGGAAVGRAGGAAVNGTTGNDSQFASLTLVKGGGFGGGGLLDGVGGNGGTGGSGGGAGRWSNSTSQFGGSPTSGQGFKGGDALSTGAGGRNGAGGGGAGAAGANITNVGQMDGGIGSSAYSSWGLATTTGQNSGGTVYYAGGGAGSGIVYFGNGGLGGGGASPVPASGAQTATSGSPNTGGGGGGMGGADEGSNKTSGAGGSGIIIVRYPMSS
jgi:hypothetical protein